MPHGNILVTIVVPVYKAELFISACVDSILKQTHHNIQLILVDDGSPDASGDICDVYAAWDSRVLVKHTANQGVSAARNEGILLAQGEYIVFVDSDDRIDADFIAEGLKDISSCGADIYLSGLNEEVFEDGSLVRSTVNKGLDKQYTVTELLNAFNVDYPFFLICGVTCKLYRLDVIRDQHVLFNTRATFGEDMLFNCDYMKNARTAVFSSGVFYHYSRGNPDSLFSRYYPDMFEINLPLYDRMLSLMQGMGCDREAVRRMEGIFVRVLVGCIYHEFAFCEQSNRQSRREVISKVSRNPFVRSCPLSNYRHPKDVMLILMLKLGFLRLINRMFTRHYCKNKAERLHHSDTEHSPHD